jgi:hypothetical protein
MLKGMLESTVTFVTATAPGTPTFAPSMTETLFDPLFEMYAKGALIAAGAAVIDSARRPTRIPKTPRVPENRLGSGHLVFMRLEDCRGSANGETT